jgi:tetratricopeptide (TPR) repeat protein
MSHSAFVVFDGSAAAPLELPVLFEGSAAAAAASSFQPRARLRAPKTVVFASFAALVWLAGLATPGVAVAQESMLDALRAAAKASPGDPAAALALGRALRRAGHGPEAQAELHRGLNAGASRPEVATQLRLEIARAYADRHDLPHAMASCKELERRKGAGPETVPTTESHACASIAYLGWQRATESLSEAAAALAMNPSSYDAKVAQGRAYELELQPTDAESAFRGAIALRSDGEEARVCLGRVLVKAGRKDEGIAELRHAIELDANDPEALYELGDALQPAPESAGLFARATSERPSFVEAYLARARGDLAAGKMADAAAAAGAALRNDPTNVAALVLSGKISLAQKNADDALRSGQAALKIVPNNAGAMLLIADSHAMKGEIDPALEAYQTAWGLDHKDPSPLVRASEACHAASRDTSARAFGAKAAQEFPNWAPGWVALGDALVGQKETKDARDAYRKALAVSDGTIDRSAVAQKLAALQ